MFKYGGWSRCSAPFTIPMKLLLNSWLVFVCWLVQCLPAVADVPAGDTPAIRQQLVQTILSSGADQQKLLGGLSETGSKLVGEVLLAWTRGAVYLYPAADGTQVPVLLEDSQDASSKARAIRIIDGQFLKDPTGKEVRFGDSDLNAADTDMR